MNTFHDVSKVFSSIHCKSFIVLILSVSLISIITSSYFPLLPKTQSVSEVFPSKLKKGTINRENRNSTKYKIKDFDETNRKISSYYFSNMEQVFHAF